LAFVAQHDAGALKGTYSSTLDFYKSLEMRKELKEKSEEPVRKRLVKAFPAEYAPAGMANDAEGNTALPVIISCNIEPGKEDNVRYINPMMADGIEENPFKPENRLYPVEMPYAMNNLYLCTLAVP
jgi:hypothetical protein